MYILEKYDGCLPVTIKAVPEGMVIPTGNVLVYIHNNGGEQTRWLTNYLETLLLQVWYPITVGTLSREIKKVFIKYLKKTTDYNKEQITGIVNFMLHDFGFRGVSSVESSGVGGLAHLVNFRGSDTATAVILGQEIYNTDEMLAFSIPASEHSTITSWGEENEVKAYENMLDAYPTGIRACVSDSYNILRACEELWGTQLREKVLNLNGRLVIRPDSGDPVQTLKRIFNILWDKFGGRINSKGFKVLDDHIRVIQGDGVNYESIIEILDMMVEEGFSAENIVFGIQLGTKQVSYGPMLGASGAIYGIMAAFAFFYPNEEMVFLFIPYPIKAKYLVPIILAIDLIFGFTNLENDPFAHFAHLGGALAGFLTVSVWFKKWNRKHWR